MHQKGPHHQTSMQESTQHLRKELQNLQVRQWAPACLVHFVYLLVYVVCFPLCIMHANVQADFFLLFQDSFLR